MANIGDLIFKLMGKEDPRTALLAAAGGGGGTSATPQPASPTSAAEGTDPGTAAPAQPQAYTSPPELFKLYTDLIDRQQRNRSIDRGIGLIGASLAHEENRAGILDAFSGSSTGNDAGTMVDSLMEFQKSNLVLQQKAAHRAALPSIAAKYGLDMATVQYLFDTGKLDSVIAEAEKPDKQIVTQDDGTSVIVDKSDGSISTPFGVPKPRKVELVDDGNGGKIAVYEDDKSPVGKNDIPGTGSTADQQNYEKAMLGLPPEKRMPFNDWLLSQKRAGATVINTGPDGVDYGDPPKDMAWARDADGKVVTRPTPQGNAPVAVPIIGGPAEAAAEDAKRSAAKKDEQRALVGDIVTEDIDRVIKSITDNRNTNLPVTGAAGNLGVLPINTDARFVRETLDTIKSNVGLDKLQAIRDASPTGAALGPVSDFENKLLQQTIGSLDQFGDPDVLIHNLRRVQKVYKAIATQKVTPENLASILGDDELSIEEIMKLHGGE